MVSKIRWFPAIFPSRFPHIICHKVSSIMLWKYFDKFKVALLLGNIGINFCWKILKLEGEQLSLSLKLAPNFASNIKAN